MTSILTTVLTLRKLRMPSSKYFKKKHLWVIPVEQMVTLY